MTAIEIEKISFSYGRRLALDQVSLQIGPGKIFALLGPNGSGKSTLFRILCTLLEPDSGSARIAGYDLMQDPATIRRRVGVVFQSQSLDQHLTVRENLIHQGHLHRLYGKQLQDRAEFLLALLGLGERSRDRVSELSGGLRRRLELAKSLLHRPQVLLLDEPTLGLDPGVRYELWKHLKRLRESQGLTLFLTTHLMDDAEHCDQLAILNQGRLIVTGTPDELKERIGGDVLTVQVPDPEQFSRQVRERLNCPAEVVDGVVRLELQMGHEFVARLVEVFPGQISAVTVGKPTLEDVFVHETGRQFEPAEDLTWTSSSRYKQDQPTTSERSRE